MALERIGRCPVGWCREYMMSASLDGFRYHVEHIHGIKWDDFLKSYPIAQDRETGDTVYYDKIPESELDCLHGPLGR